MTHLTEGDLKRLENLSAHAPANSPEDAYVSVRDRDYRALLRDYRELRRIAELYRGGVKAARAALYIIRPMADAIEKTLDEVDGFSGGVR